MALATVCPHCNTTFRVASDQLKLRGGIVRCGACQEVFDGNAALINLDAAGLPVVSQPAPSPSTEQTEPAGQPAMQDMASPEQSASAAVEAEPASGHDAQQAGADEEPVYVLDFDTTFDPFGILAKPDTAPAPEPESEPEPAPFVHAEPEPDAAVDEEITAPQLPAVQGRSDEHPGYYERADAHDGLLSSLLMRESAAPEAPFKAAPEAAPEARIEPTFAPVDEQWDKPEDAQPEELVEREALQDEPEHDEPEFVRRGRMMERTGRTRRLLMGAGSVLLALALLAQGVITFRNVLAARYPDLKPALSAACALLGCRVELPAQIETLSVETGELQSLNASTFSYSTLLRNQGTLVQAWPHLELTLTDADDKPVVRRVFAPADYLPKGVAAAKGIGPRSEQAVKLYFELNQITASGYHIAIFYP